MRALVLSGAQDWKITDVPEPEVGESNVLIQIHGSGICGSDLHTLGGTNKLVRYPVIPGHEFIGTVIETGCGVDWLAAGDRVAVDPSRSCGHCSKCVSGRGNLCPDKGGYGSRYPGGFAERVSVLGSSCVKLPDRLSFDRAILSEPLACVLHGIDRLGEVTGQTSLVFGAGPIGLLLAVALRHSGATVDIVETSSVRRSLAAQQRFNAVADVGELGDPSVSVAVDATGSPSAIETAFGVVERGGKMLMMGVTHPDAEIRISPFRMNWHEMTLLGSMAINYSFARSVELLGQLPDDLESMVTHRVPLEDFGDAIELVRTQGALKVMIQPPS